MKGLLSAPSYSLGLIHNDKHKAGNDFINKLSAYS